MKLQGWSVAGKSWVALGGALLTFIVPMLLQVSVGMPEPWPAVAAALVAVLTAVGAYHAPYAPAPGKAPQPPSTPWPTT